MEPAETSTDIARLEQRIELLQEAMARCRKIALAAKMAIAAGTVWLTLTLVWAAPFVPTLFFAALAAVIGGVVLLVVAPVVIGLGAAVVIPLLLLAIPVLFIGCIIWAGVALVT